MREKQQEFDVARGHALDVLLEDYPKIFRTSPDFSLFRKDINLRDSAGFSVSGLRAYTMFFQALRTVVPMMYHEEMVSVHVMNKYDQDKSSIRLRWKVELYRKDRRGSDKERQKADALRRLGFEVPCEHPHKEDGDRVVEGVSVYMVDEKGAIYSHRIETTQPTSLQEEIARMRLVVPDLGLAID